MTTDPNPERTFPVLLDRKASPDCPRSLPWSLLEPFEDQAKRNHGGQSLERLAERGGLAPSEIMAVVERRRWRSVRKREAEEWLIDFVASVQYPGFPVSSMPPAATCGCDWLARELRMLSDAGDAEPDGGDHGEA